MTTNLVHIYWYLSRAAGFAAFGLLWLSMVYGLLITNRMARMWPGGPTAFDLHQFTSLLALVFTGFHMLVLLGDSYLSYSLVQLLVPFGSTNYEPVWVGLGQIGFYVMALVSITFYLRNRMKPGAWRVVHYLSFGSFVMALGHGLLSGSDTGAWWASGLYWLAGMSTLFLTVYRILVRNVALPPAKQAQAIARS